MKPNVELLRETLQLIKDNPQHWDQKMWHCGTTHCFAGFVECKLRSHPINNTYPETWAIETREMLIDVLKINGLDDPERLDKLNEQYFDVGNHRNLSQVALGLSDEQANNLFCIHNTLEDLERIVEELCTQDQGDTESN